MAWWSRTREPRSPNNEKRSVPDGLFKKCESCDGTVETEKIQKNLYCCPLCGHHFVMPTEERIRATVDEDSFVEEDR
ncbi:hypothetical protein ACSTKO_24945, partial [Vibrio parahaemolyticus]